MPLCGEMVLCGIPEIKIEVIILVENNPESVGGNTTDRCSQVATKRAIKLFVTRFEIEYTIVSDVVNQHAVAVNLIIQTNLHIAKTSVAN